VQETNRPVPEFVDENFEDLWEFGSFTYSFNGGGSGS
jgi:hypothetical protein